MIRQIGFIIVLLASLQVFPQKTKRIDIINADELTFVKHGTSELKKLKGNVIFKHEDATMYCDSAFFDSRHNTMESFGNVRIETGDSVQLYCDFLRYDGIKKVANTRGNIRLYHQKSLLLTDSLDYYRQSGIAKYFTYGTIISGEDTLTSNFGYYFSRSRDFYPSGNVVVRNPDFTMTTDSLRFNTQSKKVFFLTRTKIQSDSSLIICYEGNYDTQADFAIFGKHTYIEQGRHILKGDSLLYDNKNSYGRGYKYFYVKDTANKIIVSGHLGSYDGINECMWVTDSACFSQIDDNGDTLFLHADTLKSIRDSTGRRLLAYHTVRFYHKEFQGKCDSLVYVFDDSTVIMYKKPVLWLDDFQLTARQIDILSDSTGIKQVNLQESGFIIEHLDSTLYNQIKGKNIFAYFKDGAINRIKVKRNAQTVYYPQDDSTITGLYNATSADINIELDSNRVSQITFLTAPEGTLYPVTQIPDDKSTLPGFVWLEKFRPLRKENIFEVAKP